MQFQPRAPVAAYSVQIELLALIPEHFGCLQQHLPNYTQLESPIGSSGFPPPQPLASSTIAALRAACCSSLLKYQAELGGVHLTQNIFDVLATLPALQCLPKELTLRLIPTLKCQYVPAGMSVVSTGRFGIDFQSMLSGAGQCDRPSSLRVKIS